jgi:hypothetical protein
VFGKLTSNGALSFHVLGTVLSGHRPRNGVTIPFHRNIMAAIADWDPQREALFYVIDREAGGVVAKYKVRLPIVGACTTN